MDVVGEVEVCEGHEGGGLDGVEVSAEGGVLIRCTYRSDFTIWGVLERGENPGWVFFFRNREICRGHNSTSARILAYSHTDSSQLARYPNLIKNSWWTNKSHCDIYR